MNDEEIRFILILVVLLIVGISTLRLIKRSRQKSMPGHTLRNSIPSVRAFTLEPPLALGVPSGHPARAAAERLEAALTVDFQARVKDRVLKSEPGLTDGEWQWRWFELKRYFLMCAVLRSVPMYSVKVDALWHEMLMFTREYEQFCQQFCGAFIHHAPHAPDNVQDPSDRAWFDWVYGELFVKTAPSERLWGGFYQQPLTNIEELEQIPIEELRVRRFNVRAAEAYSDLNETIHYLLDRGRYHISEARGRREGINDGANARTQSSAQWGDSGFVTGALSAALFYSSMGSPDDFRHQMDEERGEEQPHADDEGSSESGNNDADSNNQHWNGGSCSSGGDSSSGGTDGGGGGDSSCGSSCGGGCSS